MRAPATAALVVCVLGLGAWFCLRPSSEAPATANSSSAAEVTTPVASAMIAEESSSAPGAAAPVTASPSSTVAASTEESFATTLHAIEQSNPARALEMARQALKQWPNGEHAAEFARTEVKCLYALGRPSEGRGAAEAMVNKYVGSPWALEVERETGAHPYVNH